MFIGDEVYGKTNESHLHEHSVTLILPKVGYIFQGNAVSHTISMDKDLSWPLDSVKGL